MTGEQELAELTVKCNKIGDRRIGLYDTGLLPGARQAFSESLTFDNQPQPGNWRYWIDTVSATAKID